MKKIYLTCVGKLKEKFFAEGVEEYRKRLSPYCDLVINEVSDSPAKDEVQRESDAILSTFREGEMRILTDIEGELITSEGLSERIDKAFTSGRDVRFIIGGSRGVDERVKKAASARISFGRVTYPHQLMRVILCEQLYRAFSILHNTPYHK